MSETVNRRKRKRRKYVRIAGHKIDTRKLLFSVGILLILVAVLGFAVSALRRDGGGKTADKTPGASSAGKQAEETTPAAVPAAENLLDPQEGITAAEENTAPEEEAPVILLADPGEEGILEDNASVLGDVGGIGYHVNVDRTDSSNVVLIGDSRIVAMSMYAGQTSYNATVGGHLLYEEVWAKREIPMIISVGLEERSEALPYGSGYYAEMVSLIRKSMEKHGSCLVVIASTVNDGDYHNWCNQEAERMLELGSALQEDGTVGDVKPSLYYVGMVPLEGKFETEKQGFTPKYFNEYLEEQVRASGNGSYIGIGDISDWDNLYLSDGIHFQPEGTQQFFERILAGLKSTSD